MVILSIFVLVLIGLIAGMIGSLVGVGGGIVIVPSLLYLGALTTSSVFHEVTPQVAVGTSLLVVLFTGLSSTIAYMKQKKVDYKSGWIFFIGSGPGAMIGAWVNRSLDLKDFSLYFGLFIILIAIVMSVSKFLKPVEIRRTIIFQSTDDTGEYVEYGYNLPIAFSISFFVGILAGLFGIGGGALLIPAMILLFRFPPRTAVATSMLVIFLSAVTGSITHFTLGNIDWVYAICLTAGAWFGAKLGAAFNQRLKSDAIVLIFRIVLIGVGVRLMVDGLNKMSISL